MDYGIVVNKDSVIAMANKHYSAGRIADELSILGILTTEVQINKFLKDEGIVRDKIICRRTVVAKTCGKGSKGLAEAGCYKQSFANVVVGHNIKSKGSLMYQE